MQRIILLLLFSFILFSSENKEFFADLKNNLDNDIKRILNRYPTANYDEKLKLINFLEEKYQFLHNIRHYKAFSDLFKNFKFEKDHITILYLGSGAHIAPLEILKAKNFKKVDFIYTEINALVSVQLEYLLGTLSSLNYIKNLEIKVTPLPESNFFSTSQEEINRWVREFIESNKQSPPVMITYSFKFNNTDTSINLIINGKSDSKGSTPYYKASDFLKSDLIITHDWSFDPRENLSILKSTIDSCCTLNKKNIYVLMEDITKYPQPLDLTLFNIKKETSYDFGHSKYFNLPEGEKLDYEDEPALYKGAVILEPDLSFWCSLSADERETIFNLIIFKDYGFYRRNCDIFKGKILLSPPLLDIYVGYGYKDISGNNLLQQNDYLSNLSEKAIKVVKKISRTPQKKILCNYLKDFKESLKNIFPYNEKLISQKNKENAFSNPFLFSENSKKEFLKALKAKDKLKERLNKDKEEAMKSTKIIESFIKNNKDCDFENMKESKNYKEINNENFNKYIFIPE